MSLLFNYKTTKSALRASGHGEAAHPQVVPLHRGQICAPPICVRVAHSGAEQNAAANNQLQPLPTRMTGLAEQAFTFQVVGP
jgi:hypothetical protein